MTLRSTLAGIPQAKAAYQRVRPVVDAAAAHVPVLSYHRATAEATVRLAFEVMLGRQPDPAGLATYVGDLRSGALSPDELAWRIRCSDEFNTRPLPGTLLGPALHLSRMQFVRSLPAARRIVDLGGTHLASGWGALLTMGYPYSFDELVIVDLPSDERHDIYRSEEQSGVARHAQGPVRYSYHSMTDLARFADASVDLVYSGQSIEHVSPADGAQVLAEVRRILRPGGALALDTPNGRVTRLQQDEFVDPDHEVEYTWPELRSMVEAAGLVVERAHGLTRVASAAGGSFDPATAQPGLFDAIHDCYLLAVVARRP